MAHSWHDKVFFGLHFDIHANAQDTGLGSELTTEHLVAEFSKIRPDWVQCDCKGHPGYASYPSKVGNAAPGIVKDALRMWRDATRRLGIPLIMHYSGVWDSAAIAAHPEWARINAPSRTTATDGTVTLTPGKPDVNATCNLSEYTEKLMIPQMTELITEYDVDGFWVDGENWGCAPCYCDVCVAEFAKRTDTHGEMPPLDATEPRWEEWKRFHRDNFEAHVERYRSAVKKVRPTVTVCSNWMYTTRQPDDIKVPVDYLSGDFDFIWSTSRAMAEARVMDGRGLSWDLMTWTMTSTGIPHYWQFKNIEAMCSEAAVVMACGGAISFYDTPDRKGPLVSWHMDQIAEVARFCRARQQYCAGTRSVKQVAVMNSPSAIYSPGNPLYDLGEGSVTLDGALASLLACGLHVDILTENDMLARAGEYPLCVIPEQEHISAATTDAMLRYVENGGNLIVSGASLTKRFDAAAGSSDAGRLKKWTEREPLCIPLGAGTSVLFGEYRFVKNKTSREIMPLLLARDRGASEKNSGSPAAVAARYGRGSLACVYGPVFNGFGMTGYFGMLELVRKTVEALEETGTLSLSRAELPSGIHMTLRERGDSLFANFINLRTLTPLSGRSAMIDAIPPAGPAVFRTQLDSEPAAVYMAPSGAPVSWSYGEGIFTATVPQIGIHDILVIERRPAI